jgi:hypothetical protein
MEAGKFNIEPRMMRSFMGHQGHRGVHFYNDSKSVFASWEQVVKFTTKEIPDENLQNCIIQVLANYNPDTHAFAVKEMPNAGRLELIPLARRA